VDIDSVPALYNMGYLGTHKEIDSDNVVGYIDWDMKLFTQGLVNQLVRIQGQSTTFERGDKIKK
jgi:hypothetical protein